MRHTADNVGSADLGRFDPRLHVTVQYDLWGAPMTLYMTWVEPDGGFHTHTQDVDGLDEMSVRDMVDNARQRFATTLCPLKACSH